MAKRKEKELVKKPDAFIVWFNTASEFIRRHFKETIAAIVILLIAVGAGYTYMLHLNSQEDRMQQSLAQGIQSFGEYGMSGSQESLTKAETIFTEVSRKNIRDTRYIAKLYLGKIQYIRGKNEEARKFYQEVFKSSSNSALKKLAERALQHIN
ncbi:MAG TPA: hypothetical protein VHO84_00950 [Syntrophorhabdaceae bacterium]|nr:hypothetical protein [Syntrophorhabdaceae bacterium]